MGRSYPGRAPSAVMTRTRENRKRVRSVTSGRLLSGAGDRVLVKGRCETSHLFQQGADAKHRIYFSKAQMRNIASALPELAVAVLVFLARAAGTGLVAADLAPSR